MAATSEPHRVFRRPRAQRIWCGEDLYKLLARAMGTGSAARAETSGRAPVAVGSERLGGGEDRLLDRDASQLGARFLNAIRTFDLANERRARPAQGAGAREPRVVAGERGPSQDIGVLRPSGTRPSTRDMEPFTDAHRGAQGVVPICGKVPIAPSSYYERKARESDPDRLPARLCRDRHLRAHVRGVWEES